MLFIIGQLDLQAKGSKRRDTSLLGEDQCPRDHVEYMEDDYDMDDATDNTGDGHHERGIRPELRFEGCESREVILRKNLG